MTIDTDVNRFMRLFRGNSRSFGVWNPANGRMKTEHAKVSIDEFKKHLEGASGLGIVAVMDNSTVCFGAIDIDTPEDDTPIDIEAIDKKILELRLPLIPCRSKSGGVHCYFFCDKPLPAASVRGNLSAWANAIGYPGVEIFPKQSSLKMDDAGNRQLGNWINLCYFKEQTTQRYALVNGKKLSLQEFLALAERNASDSARFIESDDPQFIDAPPCLDKLRNEVIGDGVRNQALYNFTVFFKQFDPKNYRDLAMAMNARFPHPLPEAEAKKTVASAGRRSYVYKCGEEPCNSRCNRDLCLTRKFGIGSFVTAGGSSSPDNMPRFTALQKIDVDPPKWVLTVNDRQVELTTQQLMHAQYLQYALAETLLTVIAIPERAWHAILNDLMKKATVVDAPDEASSGGMIRAKLREFVTRARAEEDRKVLLRGIPIILALDGAKYVVFRGTDFVNYLKRNKSEELRGSNLWMALRKMGVGHRRLRLDDETVLSAWFIPMDESDQIVIPAPEITTEL